MNCENLILKTVSTNALEMNTRLDLHVIYHIHSKTTLLFHFFDFNLLKTFDSLYISRFCALYLILHNKQTEPVHQASPIELLLRVETEL